MSHTEHQQAGKALMASCAVITVSDTRTRETDTSGARLAELLTGAGHTVTLRDWVPDEPERIRSAVLAAREAGCRLILTTGGTGISRRDTSFEALHELIDTEIPGFGELFRMLSWQDIGPAAMMSRAVAGLSAESVLFVLPGSKNAVELAMQQLILPQIGHLLAERRK
ncbi:MAG: MogA/MoaB family molybdenum cofactor biosynthesis protein [Bacteroidetes bacterium]|nr:MogA/MoaB family molybdenum cofactor biosynthesis protein [Bacteroidota bacterium]